MKQNIGIADRFIRLLLAITLWLLTVNDIGNGWLPVVWLIIACIIVASAILGNCPIYTMLGIHTTTATRKKNKNRV